MNAWQNWLDRATESDSARALARRLGRSHTTARRWMNTPASCEDVIAIAREYCVDPIEGLVAAGWLRESDFTSVGLQNAISRAPAASLAEELHNRFASGRLDADIVEIRKMFR